MALRTCLILGLLCSSASAQPGLLCLPRPSGQFELSETVQIDRADGAALAQLERVKACLDKRQPQYDEAVETLRQVMESGEGKLLEIAPGHFVNLSDACQMRLAALPPEALKLYRGRIDPVAKKWYDDGFARRDAKVLNNVVHQAFASSFGDKALMALGEIHLEQGDFSAARWCWERILPVRVPPGEISTWPGFPDSTIDPASVRARLVLVSILEGSLERAQGELSRFVRLHGDARGRLGGREVRYADELARLLDQSRLWPKSTPGADWPTFAGSPERNALAPEVIDVAAVQWRAKFGARRLPPPVVGAAGCRGRPRRAAGVSSCYQPGPHLCCRRPGNLRFSCRVGPASVGRPREFDQSRNGGSPRRIAWTRPGLRHAALYDDHRRRPALRPHRYAGHQSAAAARR